MGQGAGSSADGRARTDANGEALFVLSRETVEHLESIREEYPSRPPPVPLRTSFRPAADLGWQVQLFGAADLDAEAVDRWCEMLR